MKFADFNRTDFINRLHNFITYLVDGVHSLIFQGCRVVACAGSEEKCQWLRSELGFDYVFNYKTAKLDDALKEGAPNGIDCYFDNVN